MPNFYIHVGLTKTASTTLQSNVFPHLKPVYLGRKYIDGKALDYDGFDLPSIKIILEKISRQTVVSDDWRNVFEEVLCKFGQESDFLISSENFLRPNNLLGLETLGKYAFDCPYKIFLLVSVRSQTEWVQSRYRHNLKRLPLSPVKSILRRFFHRFGVVYRAYSVEDALYSDSVCAFPYCSSNDIRCACVESNVHPIDLIDPSDLMKISKALNFHFFDFFLNPINSIQSLMDLTCTPHEQLPILLNGLNKQENKG